MPPRCRTAGGGVGSAARTCTVPQEPIGVHSLRNGGKRPGRRGRRGGVTPSSTTRSQVTQLVGQLDVLRAQLRDYRPRERCVLRREAKEVRRAQIMNGGVGGRLGLHWRL
jgi:hypothetical protein